MATTIKTKSSNVAGKVPDSSSLQPAELAINLKDHKLYSKDVDGVVFEISGEGSVDSGPNPPGSGNEIGDLFFDTTNQILLYWSGTEWLPVSGDLDAEYVKLDDGGTEQSITGGGGLDVAGGITSEFGTNAAQLGNVAPLNDWSCYPARTTIYSAPPAPTPQPELIDPDFGVEGPTFSGGMAESGGFVVSTQDIIDLEGE